MEESPHTVPNRSQRLACVEQMPVRSRAHKAHRQNGELILY